MPNIYLPKWGRAITSINLPTLMFIKNFHYDQSMFLLYPYGYKVLVNRKIEEIGDGAGEYVFVCADTGVARRCRRVRGRELRWWGACSSRTRSSPPRGAHSVTRDSPPECAGWGLTWVLSSLCYLLSEPESDQRRTTAVKNRDMLWESKRLSASFPCVRDSVCRLAYTFSNS